jgi:anaerobic glycerol-3-phosphate dehydrogenase
MTGGVRTCDVLVVGRGAAGCVAASRLAAVGAKVLLIGRESSATSLSTGRLDLRGVGNEDALSGMMMKLGARFGMYQASPGPRNIVSNCGTIGCQTLSSEHDWTAGPGDRRTAVVGLKGNPDLDPALVCSALKRTSPDIDCRPYRAGLELPSAINAGSGTTLTEEANAAVERIARFLEDLDEDEAVLPPLFTGANHGRAWSSLERSSGLTVREAMTPLSNPGRRLQACLEEAAVRAGCTLWRERELVGLETDGHDVVGAVIRSGLRTISVRPRALLLATGNLVSGGLAVQGDEVIDPLGLFAVAGADTARISSPALGRCLSTGIRNEGGRAVLVDGTITGNIWVAGSAVPGCSYPLGRGLGPVLADAWAKSELVKEAL